MLANRSYDQHVPQAPAPKPARPTNDEANHDRIVAKINRSLDAGRAISYAEVLAMIDTREPSRCGPSRLSPCAALSEAVWVPAMSKLAELRHRGGARPEAVRRRKQPRAPGLR